MRDISENRGLATSPIGVMSPRSTCWPSGARISNSANVLNYRLGFAILSDDYRFALPCGGRRAKPVTSNAVRPSSAPHGVGSSTLPIA
jgi:hypothetical protein